MQRSRKIYICFCAFFIPQPCVSRHLHRARFYAGFRHKHAEDQQVFKHEIMFSVNAPYAFKRLVIQCIMWTNLGLFGIFFFPHKKMNTYISMFLRLLEILFAFSQQTLCSLTKPEFFLSKCRVFLFFFQGERTSFESKCKISLVAQNLREKAKSIEYIQLYYSLLSPLGALQNFHFWVTHTFKINLHLSIQIYISTVHPAILYSLLFMDLLSEE